MEKCYIIGHKHPDNDSIMAAYTYAFLKNKRHLDNYEFVPARVGVMPIESEMVFDRFGIKNGCDTLIRHVGPEDNIVMVDHNEVAQAVDGIQTANVLEIIDHHRIADKTTARPIFFLNIPLGSTTSIITELYKIFHVNIKRSIAGCLLSALLTDTAIMKSPTTTPKDIAHIEELGELAEVNPQEFGIELYKSRGSDDDATPDDVVNRDTKEFNFGKGRRALVSQFETIDIEHLRERYDEITEAAEETCEYWEYDVLLLAVTDILKEGSDFIAVGKIGFIEEAFNINLKNGPVWMPGVISRKKQIASVLFKHCGLGEN